ncbi:MULTISPECIES: type I DNA topoisomerase [Candidatus Phytoplasma]|uniref:DNA topoisomerase 1 n=2 Tax=Candidatus Phytoplasma TaxID=33926 RepID=A0ABN0J8K9_PEWBP|nr:MULTISPECIES: type I DNA topoisomerase [Phytoplasma]QLL36838.1 DNA topoisomerase I ['Echinacea purpurea' witches'-broom phytoplasma]WEX20490.1 MAG: DNA topoisomerase I [Candidatus Phytoplasma aurantifolia]WKV64085.1 MAG: DNA topoisomerase I [Candidatus Phytoplasma australasiaticum]EMR14790.1 DNA topoisomerase I [Peanut witches'-broom phytoplasma NTU2011]MDO8052739.1 type I DNA topoisomerase ['Vigna radiata' phytoplasma]
MKSQVIIVESPSKAKTISSFFDHKILVLSSKGHIRNLSLKGNDNLGIDIDNNFKPDYCIIKGKEKLVQDLISKTKDKYVFIATDFDREGEAIAWHLAQVLKLKPLDKNRIFFSEINKNVVIKAFNNPVTINKRLVESQETRLILDKIIGFKLSSLVRRIRSKSAGRVQSVALKLVAEREKEHNDFIPEEYYLIKAIFENFTANLIINPKNPKIKLEEANQILNQLKNKKFYLKDIIKTKNLNKPPKPFITATLQQESFKYLGMNARKTMIIAQKLYEGVKIDQEIIGLITYMRTDSYRMSEEFVENAQSFISEKFGSSYVNDIKLKNLSKNRIEAHEAIRITDIKKTPQQIKSYLNKDELSLYNLIYQKTISSLMSAAVINKTQFIFEIEKYLFQVEGYQMIFDGYLKTSFYSNFKEILLPDWQKHQYYLPQKVIAKSQMTLPPPRYNEASLIKHLENLKIGRPSTYSHIIETLKNRYYVNIKDKKMICTQRGLMTNELLIKFFNSFINIEYTAYMEEQLDNIANGKVDKITILNKFYDDFIKLFINANNNIKVMKNITTQKKCTICGDFMVERYSKYGVFLGCNAYPKCKNSDIDQKKSIILTNQNCSSCGSLMAERNGKYGKFLGCSTYPKCKQIISFNKNNKSENKKKEKEKLSQK